jgi:hypothetical protein
VGLAVCFSGFIPLAAALLRARATRLVDWLLFSIGLIVCVGSKENMLFLGAFFACAIAAAWKRGERKQAVLFGLLDGAMLLLVAAAVYLSAKNTGVDIHSAPTDFATRLTDLSQFFFSAMPLSLLLSGGIGLAYGLVAQRFPRNGTPAPAVVSPWAYALLLLCIFWLVFSQKLFYPGTWPAANRYAFPGVLSLALLLAANLNFFQKLAPAGKFSAGGRFAFACLVSGLIVLHGLTPIRTAVAQQVAATQAFSGRIERIAAAARPNPTIQIVIGSSAALDYETIFSIIRFVRARGVENPTFLDYTPAAAGDIRLKTLEGFLIDFSRLGSYKPVFINDWEYWQGDRPKRLNPLAQFDPNRPCILVNLSGEHPAFSGCPGVP